MQKSDLVEKIAKENGLSMSSAKQIVDLVFQTLRRSIIESQDERYTLPGIGHLVISKTNARQARNPKTGEPVTIPPRRKITFRASKLIKDVLHQPLDE